MQEKEYIQKMENKGGDDDDETSTNFYVLAAMGTVTGAW
jgi:hypothetical protein